MKGFHSYNESTDKLRSYKHNLNHEYRIAGKFGEMTFFKHLAKESLVN